MINKKTTGFIIIAISILTGCTGTANAVNKKNDYESQKPNYIEEINNKIENNQPKERYFNINIGDSAKIIFERLSYLDGNVYILDTNDFRATFSAPGIKSLDDTKNYFKVNDITVESTKTLNTKYVKISFSKTSLGNIEKKLSAIKVKASGSIPVNAILQDIASRAKLSIVYTDKSAKNIALITKNIELDTDGLGAIKQIVNSSDLDFKIAENNIEVSYFKTETLNLDIFARDRNIINNISNNSSSSSQGAGSSSNSTASSSTGSGAGMSQSGGSSSSSDGKNLEVKYITGLVKELETSVESLLSEHGSFKLMPSAGQIVIRDKAENVKNIQKAINNFNSQFKDTIEVRLTFYKVTTNKADKRGLDFRSLNGRIAASASGMTNFATSGNVASIFGLEYNSPSTTALFNLLSEFGTTEVVNPIEVVTQSNMLKTLKIANNYGYIASISSTANTTTGTTASITPSSVPDGMFFSLLAKPIDNNHIAVDIYATNNSFVKFNTASAFGSTVQTPDTSEQSIDGYHQLQIGTPQVLVSHKYEESTSGKAGLPVEFLHSLGYKEDSSKDTYIVIALEARVR
ncbi:MAG: hypothetical protein QG567_2176 [Campylobacterota bacterium]|nr:hypothetical protein [Campylobacterota bacterium]